RGRAGRQGDPGSSRFYLSLEDDLLRIFGSDNISGLMQRLGMEEGVPIESKLITRQIERAQKQVEARNFEMRKHLLEYDDVMNKQREEIYRFRRELLEGEDQKEYILEMAEDVALELLDEYADSSVDPSEWDLENLKVNVLRIYGFEIPGNVPVSEISEGAGNGVENQNVPLGELSRAELETFLLSRIRAKYEAKEKEVTPQMMRWFERVIMLQILDQQWKDHLLALDHLKEGIGLRGYGQRDPKIEYKRESFTLFEELHHRVREEIVRMLYLLRPATRAEEDEILTARGRQTRQQDMQYSGGEAAEPAFAGAQARPQQRLEARGGGDAAVKTIVNTGPKVGRNDPCPCGSGKKFKKCCGR
ncbi:MAG TPA: SEC-C metal-binding domain-containing protein, partial [Acidobacteriota bacterium]|nr:SEC-C metal-binding domain-containing protein [Acidobacteriota bacterium]